MTSSHYIGQELDIFALAVNWKRYWSSQIQPHIKGSVLEVGAGLGANTDFFGSDRVSSWTCLEPDPALVDRMRQNFLKQSHLKDCRIETGTTSTFGPGTWFDTIIYIDVLEHIEADREELAQASRLLRTAGKIIVLSPAHQWLFTPFDRAVGHYRRYNKSTLRACSPADCKIEQLEYLDSVGMLASVGNRLLLQQAIPTLKQILFWDHFLVPPSKVLDRLTLRLIGKSILAVWVKS